MGGLLSQEEFFSCVNYILSSSKFDETCLFLSLITRFFHKSFENTSSILLFLSHLCSVCVWFVVVARLCLFHI